MTFRFPVVAILAFAALVASDQHAFGQSADTSGNGTLKGDYFIREVLITGQNTNGSLSSAASVLGVATFDGAGNYKFQGQGAASATLGSATSQSFSGIYQVAANGLLSIQSFIDISDFCSGGVAAIGPSAFVASATERGNVDILIAIPAGSTATAAALKGSYTAGFVDYLNADINMVREANLTFSADGAGNIGTAGVNGYAVNLGGKATTQTVGGVTYSLAGKGSGTVTFGAASASQLVSGPKTLYVSADGNIFLAGNPAGFDLMVGLRGLSAPASNATSSGLYFTAGLEDVVVTGTTTTHAIDGFYGSVNSNGLGTSITHSRFQSFSQSVFDYTYDTMYTVPASGVFGDGGYYQYALGAGGNAFVGTGLQGLYSLTVGFGAPKFSGPGVYLNPTGIVSAASFAPITNPVAPNEIVTIFGTGMAPGLVSAPSLPLPTTLGGVQVTVNGQAAPLFYVTPGQIALLVPQTVSPANQVFYATFQVNNNGVKSNAVTIFTNYTAPGVFSAGGNAVGPALAQHPDYTLVNAAKPARIGETIVLYAGGLGAVSPPVGDGAPAPSVAPLSTITDTDFVDIGGTQGNIVFGGLTPGLAGLYQLNTTVLTGTPTGSPFVNISTPDAFTSMATVSVSAAANGSAVSAVRDLAVAHGRVAADAAGFKRTNGLPQRSQR